MLLPDNAGEEWLKLNDPEGREDSALREVPWGTSHDIEILVERSLDPHRTHRIRGYEIIAAQVRPCLRCDEEYVPVTSWQKFCSGNCRKAAFKGRKRATHSDEE